MNDDDKTFQCPICVKGKYKECSLIQHLIDKHPDFPASKKIRNEYHFPLSCPLCAQKITTPVAFMTHYKQYHQNEFRSLKIALGFDFENKDSIFKSSDQLDIIPNLSPTPVFILHDDDKLFQTLFNLTNKSPIMHSILKSSNILIICCISGIILLDLNTKGLNEYLQNYIKNQVPVIEFNTPNETHLLQTKYGISLPTNVKTDPFICQNYTKFVRAYGPCISSNEDVKIDITKNISKVDLRLSLMNIAIAYHYLISLQFFPVSSNTNSTQDFIKCPCCDLTASNTVSLYRHLFRQHAFPAMIMNQYKMAEQPKGKFICESCHEQNLTSYDDLIIHVFENHRKELLLKTVNYIDTHPEISKNNPELDGFIKLEYKKISC